MSLEWLLSFAFFFMVGSGIAGWICNYIDELGERRRRAENAARWQVDEEYRKAHPDEWAGWR